MERQYNTYTDQVIADHITHSAIMLDVRCNAGKDCRVCDYLDYTVDDQAQISELCTELQGDCNPRICSRRKLDVQAYEIESTIAGLRAMHKIINDEIKRVGSSDPFGNYFLTTIQSNINFVKQQLEDILKARS